MTWQSVGVLSGELTAMANATGLALCMAPGAEQVIAVLAQLSWDPSDGMDQAALERRLSLQELISLLAAKGLLKATREPGRSRSMVASFLSDSPGQEEDL
jgi:hypothetical protein